MGNHPSAGSKDEPEPTERLLRRNMRSAFPNLLNAETGRSIRSRSLEPRSAEQLPTIEHSKSARYPKKKQRVWDPNDPRLYLKHGTPIRYQITENGRDENRCVTKMTLHQKTILQKVWMRGTEGDIMDCSRSIFSHLLRSNAQLYHLFGLATMTDKEIVNSSTFARQSANFAIAFDFVITNLIEDLERVCIALQRLGSHHAHILGGVENSMWSLFTRVFEDNPPKLVFLNAEGHKAWKLMVGFVIRQMRIGYENGLAELAAGANCLHVDRAFV